MKICKNINIIIETIFLGNNYNKKFESYSLTIVFLFFFIIRCNYLLLNSKLTHTLLCLLIEKVYSTPTMQQRT